MGFLEECPRASYSRVGSESTWVDASAHRAVTPAPTFRAYPANSSRSSAQIYRRIASAAAATSIAGRALICALMKLRTTKIRTGSPRSSISATEPTQHPVASGTLNFLPGRQHVRTCAGERGQVGTHLSVRHVPPALKPPREGVQRDRRDQRVVEPERVGR